MRAPGFPFSDEVYDKIKRASEIINSGSLPKDKFGKYIYSKELVELAAELYNYVFSEEYNKWCCEHPESARRLRADGDADFT